MSLLGNLYLRVTSKKIQRRVEGEPALVVVDIARQAPEGSSLRDLLISVDRLGKAVQDCMQRLLVADALDDIMMTLQKVRGIVDVTWL